MASRDILILAGLGGVGLWLYSQQAQASSDNSSDTGSGFDFGSLIGTMTDTIKNTVENAIMGTTRGERNNNPGNILYSINNPWQGATGIDSAGFVIFDTPENGLRAMYITLKNQIARGLNSLAALIPTYSATDQAAYIANVSAWTGLDPYQVFDAGFIPVLAPAMIRMENGKMPLTQGQLAYAASAAGVG